MKFYATHIVIGLAVLGAAFVFVGCGDEEITVPEVEYLPQTFSLAVSDGAADNLKQGNHGYSHNGNATIELDWNGTSGSSNSLPVVYIYDEYPLIDGGPTDEDAAIWASADWTNIALTPQYGDGGVTTVRMKALYTYVNPPRIWFLLNWDDPMDYPDAEMPYNSGMYGNCWYNTGNEDDYAGFEHDHNDPDLHGIAWDHNEDWVSFMWDTWHRDYPGGYNTNPSSPAYGEPLDPNNWVFVEQAEGFQSNGCAVTCHSDDPDHPHVVRNTDYNYNKEGGHGGPEEGYVDMWIWSGTRSNYTSLEGEWLSGLNDPATPFDCFLDNTGMNWGPIDQKMSYDDGSWLMWYQSDSGLYGFLGNGTFRHGTEQSPQFMSEYDPGDNQAYFWFSDFIFGFQKEFAVDAWEAGDKISGYVNRGSLGSAADISARGSYSTADGEWTLELERNIGNYDNINNIEDCLIGIYEAHPGE